MRSSRVRVLLPLVTALVVALVLPPSATAYEQYYCGVVLAPRVSGSDECRASGLHSVDLNQAWYPGPAEHHVKVCEYVWNNRVSQIRVNPNTGARTPYCEYGIASTYYGPTAQADYNGRVYNSLQTCCPHTINGYESA